ncbi:hypothetical protein FOXG_18445 [Fusarium oxysporum f. sp. lycopersici 4287]|uniref:Uncharacterized protein n=1 Tax=Fusarium oxysporum f. sp. lycopersici (strain 4287 / CBS 123668 / FGSC 9935 / NRRL 34936) TaxID=426428 RepID=A0A0J9WIK3_FUSO4|nr:hypothetical protein FOXG_18445 [Fusarium oxysporum f. sp. lycopersici 4287]XP_018236728.1 hypothetical protein FOXG_18445 [Fusarium oxysporum f. sp. lycopersici 4287]KNA98681.1 hypothetical protein FOXG_18445 [Fusarium oxysporum f. sp. lycopersici 4287]KNA98682.1 hypothetical protein FOXG_18445 [Fusarium oxysporum f. sp. lycopersici 4287]
MQSDLTKEESSEQKPVDRMSTALLRTARRAGAKQRWRWRNGRRIWRDRAFGTGRVGSASAAAESTHVNPAPEKWLANGVVSIRYAACDCNGAKVMLTERNGKQTRRRGLLPREG